MAKMNRSSRSLQFCGYRIRFSRLVTLSLVVIVPPSVITRARSS